MHTAPTTSMRRCLLHEVARFKTDGFGRHSASSSAAADVSVDAPQAGPHVTAGLQPGIQSLVRELVHRGHQRNPQGQLRIGLRQRTIPASTTSWVVFVEDSGPGSSLQLDGVDPAGPSFPSWLTELAQRVDAMGGQLGAQAQQGPGRGTVIWFSLPDQLFVNEHTASHVEDRIRGRRVLVVDDNVVNSKVLEGLLERWGCEVTLAHDGAEASRILIPGGFDLVLMDVQMPVMDGYETTRALRSRPGPSQSVPIVAVTAHARPIDRSRCFEAGMDGHVAKPVRPALLVAAMNRAMRPRAY